MTDESIRDTFVHALNEIAPEADPGTLDPTQDLREQFELDSLDVLNFVVKLSEDTGIAIPESDYTQVLILDSWIAYVREREPAHT